METKKVCLIDLDGTVFDFNAQFIKMWNGVIEQIMNGYRGHAFTVGSQSDRSFLDGKLPSKAYADYPARKPLGNDFKEVLQNLFITEAAPTHFHLHEAWPHKMTAEDAEKIMSMPGFFETMELIPGAKEALRVMLNSNIVDPFLCTAPVVSSPACWTEKVRAIQKCLGQEWLARTIITRDKTLVKGTWLIDDKPNIHGAVQPDWIHILYDQPHNRPPCQLRPQPKKVSTRADQDLLTTIGRPRITWNNWVNIFDIPDFPN